MSRFPCFLRQLRKLVLPYGHSRVQIWDAGEGDALSPSSIDGGEALVIYY